MKTVLIVEDDPVNARIFSKILMKRGGLNVKHTEDVDEVLEIAKAHDADVILMDVSLSRSIYDGESVDGVKITQLLKKDPLTASIPVILVTAFATQGDRERFLQESGADAYVSKPVVDQGEFITIVKGLISSEE